MEKKHKHLAKDIGFLLSVFVPLLFILICGSIWTNDGFDGTVMETLFPAIFYGLVAGYMTLLIISNIFRNFSTFIWIIVAALVCAATIVVYMLNLMTVLTVGAIVMGSLLCILLLIKWIAG